MKRIVAIYALGDEKREYHQRHWELVVTAAINPKAEAGDRNFRCYSHKIGSSGVEQGAYDFDISVRTRVYIYLWLRVCSRIFLILNNLPTKCVPSLRLDHLRNCVQGHWTRAHCCVRSVSLILWQRSTSLGKSSLPPCWFAIWAPLPFVEAAGWVTLVDDGVLAVLHPSRNEIWCNFFGIFAGVQLAGGRFSKFSDLLCNWLICCVGKGVERFTRYWGWRSYIFGKMKL